jgi:DNA-binding NarL/FixJ family response regulator
MNTTIVTVDDDRNFRDVLQGLLRQDAGITLIGEAENGEEAVRRTRELHPDVVLMDITMPRVNGFDATRSIKSYRPQTKVIILTVHADYTYEQAALGNGADAFIAKKRLSSDLLPTIHGLMAPNEAESAPKSEPSDTVLVIDNDSEFGGQTAAYLRANMSAVIECANAEAQKLALPEGAKPRVVVVDAEHNDSEFLSGLRGRFPGVGIIALTPSDSSRITESNLVAGADALVARNRIAVELIPAIIALVSTQPKLARALDVTGEL